MHTALYYNYIPTDSSALVFNIPATFHFAGRIKCARARYINDYLLRSLVHAAKSSALAGN